jgi:hypothetical protein
MPFTTASDRTVAFRRRLTDLVDAGMPVDCLPSGYLTAADVPADSTFVEFLRAREAEVRHFCRDGRQTATASASASDVARRVLRRLHVNADAPVQQYADAYRTFLPQAAERGMYAILADAGSASWTVEQTLAWLASHLQLRPSGGELPWWDQVWQDAAVYAHTVGKVGLSGAGRRQFVTCLYRSPVYEQMCMDALAFAFSFDS